MPPKAGVAHSRAARNAGYPAETLLKYPRGEACAQGELRGFRPLATLPAIMTDNIPFLPARKVDALLDYKGLVAALRAAFAGNWTVPIRHHHGIEMPDGEADQTLLLMPAWEAGKSIGIKIVTITPGNGARNLPAVQGLYLLLDGLTGEPRALIDGKALTVRRTAAASALAADYCARPDAATHLMVGAGALSRPLIEAHRAVRPITRSLLWARDPKKAAAKAEELKAAGIAVEVAPDLEAAVRAADIISTGTLSHEPLVKGAWLRPGQHLDLVGAFLPEMRESDDEAVRRARVYVDTMAGALKEAGDIVLAIKSGALTPEDIVADLHGLARGTAKGRQSPDEITLFKSVGTALEDLAAARLLMERAG
ncbi:bifunctional Delta(1)-pyrroline-2-carboxylate/Delta(1)-piperideine-2-carboxylate reductase [Dongia mobilis]|nr:ornithine cyclodeaminase family protein [Dongia mobilis]